MKTFLVVILGLVCFCAMGQDFEPDTAGGSPSAASVSPGSTSGTVISVTGQVILYPPNKPAEKIDVNESDRVYSNYIIETLESASAIVKLSDGKGYIYIGGKANLRIDYYYDIKMKIGGFRIFLNKGKIRAYSPDLESPRFHFTIITPNSSVGTLGGDLSVEVRGEITQIITYLNYAVVHYLPADFKTTTKHAVVGEEKKFLVSTKRGMLKSTIKLNADEIKEKNLWSKYKIEIEYPDKETRQDVLIDKEIKRIENESVRNPALRHAL